jgi:hypothetical protein
VSGSSRWTLSASSSITGLWSATRTINLKTAIGWVLIGSDRYNEFAEAVKA